MSLSQKGWRRQVKAVLERRAPDFVPLGELFAQVYDVIPVHTAIRYQALHARPEKVNGHAARWDIMLSIVRNLAVEYDPPRPQRTDGFRGRAFTERDRVRVVPRPCVTCGKPFVGMKATAQRCRRQSCLGRPTPTPKRRGPRPCEQCQTVFTPEGRHYEQRFCSRACVMAARRAVTAAKLVALAKDCPECGTFFTPKHPGRASVCSNACARRRGTTVRIERLAAAKGQRWTLRKRPKPEDDLIGPPVPA